MIVRMVTLEGLQQMVTEAFFQEGDNIQCGLEDMRLEEMKESTNNWNVWISSDDCNQHVLCGSDLYGLHLSYVLKWGHTERRYYDNWQHTDWRADGEEYRTKEFRK